MHVDLMVEIGFVSTVGVVSPIWCLFRNHTANEFMLNNWWDDGYNQIAFGRGSSGFVVINRDDNKAINRSFQTGMPAENIATLLTAITMKQHIRAADQLSRLMPKVWLILP